MRTMTTPEKPKSDYRRLYFGPDLIADLEAEADRHGCLFVNKLVVTLLRGIIDDVKRSPKGRVLIRRRIVVIPQR